MSEGMNGERARRPVGYRTLPELLNLEQSSLPLTWESCRIVKGCTRMGALIRQSGLWQSADKIAGQRAWGPKGHLRQGSRHSALKGMVSYECFPPDPSFAWWPDVWGVTTFCSAQHLKPVFLIDCHNGPNKPDKLTFWCKYCAHKSSSAFPL